MAATKSSSTLDLTKCQTCELAEEIAELINAPQAFLKILKITAYCFIACLIGCFLAYKYASLVLLVLLVACLYALLLSLGFGFAWGVLRVCSGALQNVESILRILLEITGRAAQDYEQLQTGKMKPPSTGELLRLVYRGVFVPVMEKTVAKVLGVFGVPLIWVYRRTVGWAVDRVAKRIQEQPESEAEIEMAEQAVETAEPSAVSQYAVRIQAKTAYAADRVGSVCGSLKRYVMAPLYMMFWLALGAALIPLAIIGWLFTGS